MKTTKRSKMLLSSIAMLLVALVALGSATYAWYAINRGVTADTINVKASTPGGLLISKTSASEGFGTSVTLDGMSDTGGKTLEPAALTYGGTAADYGVSAVEYKDADDADASASTGSATSVTAATALGTYYVADQIWVKSDSTKAGSVQATVKATGTTTDSFLHFVLVDAASASSTFANLDTSALTSGTAANAGSAVSYQANGATVKSYYVIVFADGNDTDCYTNNTNKANAISYELKFTLTDA